MVFDDMISDMLSNKKRNPLVTQLFIRGRNTSYFDILKDIKLNSTLFCYKNLK